MHPAQSEPSLGSPWLELARGQGQGSLERQSKGREEEQEVVEVFVVSFALPSAEKDMCLSSSKKGMLGK